MALDPREILRSGNLGGEAPAAPLAGTRRERVQRLQLGLFGLGTMVLLVGLANIIMTSAQQNQASVPEDLPVEATVDVPPPAPRDPLADAGVVPELPVEPQGEEAGRPQQVPGDVPPPPSSD